MPTERTLSYIKRRFPVKRYEWREARGLSVLLNFARHHDLMEVIGDMESQGIYSDHAAAAVFDSGHVIVVETSAAYEISEMTPGEPATVRYFILTPIPQQ